MYRNGSALKLLTASAVVAAGLAFSVPAAAQAAGTATASSCTTSYPLVKSGTTYGYMEWSQNPNSCYGYGDSFRVCDTNTDGLYLDGFLGTRLSTTEGIPAPSCGDWKGGNLVEGSKHTIDIYVLRTGVQQTSFHITVTA